MWTNLRLAGIEYQTYTLVDLNGPRPGGVYKYISMYVGPNFLFKLLMIRQIWPA